MSERLINKCNNCSNFIEAFETKNKLLEIIYSTIYREYITLLLRYVEKKDLYKTGAALGVTRERVRQLEEKAFKRIIYKAKLLLDFSLQPKDIIQFLEDHQSELQLLEKKEIYVIKKDHIKEDYVPYELKHKEPTIIEQIIPEQVGNLSLENLKLSRRPYMCLKVEGILQIKDLVVKTENDLLKIKNFGRKALREVKEALAVYNLKLKD